MLNWRQEHQKYKGQVVLRGDIVKEGLWVLHSIHWTRIFSISNDSSNSHGHHLQIARLRWTSSRRSISWYPSKNGRCSQIVEKFPNRGVQTFGFVYHDTNGPKSWSNMEDPVVPLEGNLHGHPLAGLLWQRQFEKVLLKHGWEKIPNWERLFVHREKGFFLSVHENWLERNKILIRCGNCSTKKLIWENQHLSWIMYTWDVLKDSVKQAKTLWTISEPCSNREFPRGEQRNYHSLKIFIFLHGLMTWLPCIVRFRIFENLPKTQHRIPKRRWPSCAEDWWFFRHISMNDSPNQLLPILRSHLVQPLISQTCRTFGWVYLSCSRFDNCLDNSFPWTLLIPLSWNMNIHQIMFLVTIEILFCLLRTWSFTQCTNDLDCTDNSNSTSPMTNCWGQCPFLRIDIRSRSVTRISSLLADCGFLVRETWSDFSCRSPRSFIRSTRPVVYQCQFSTLEKTKHGRHKNPTSGRPDHSSFNNCAPGILSSSLLFPGLAELEDTCDAIFADFAVVRSSFEFWDRFACQNTFQRAQQMIPLIMCEISFGLNVNKLLDVLDLDLWNPDWFFQTTNQAQLCGFLENMSHCGTPSFTGHFDHCFIVPPLRSYLLVFLSMTTGRPGLSCFPTRNNQIPQLEKQEARLISVQSTEMISDSVELWETAVCFLHIQLCEFQKSTMFLQKWIWIFKIAKDVRVLKQSQSALFCSGTHISHVWWTSEINQFRRLSHALVHFVVERASLFTDHKMSRRPILAKCKHFRTIWEHVVDNSPTDFISSSLKWWSSMHGADALWSCWVVLFANSQNRSTHFFAWPIDPMEFEWNIFPGFTTLQLCDKINDLLSSSGQTPETFTGRTSVHVNVQWHLLWQIWQQRWMFEKVMSMFNDISCGTNENEEVWQMLDSFLCMLEDCWDVMNCRHTNAADQETIETIFRMNVSANQLSLHRTIVDVWRGDPLWWDIPHTSSSGQWWPNVKNLIATMQNELRSCSQDNWAHVVVEVGQHFVTEDLGGYTQQNALIRDPRKHQKLGACWKLQPITCVNVKLKSELCLWTTTLTPGSEFLIDQISLWWPWTTMKQKIPEDQLKEHASKLNAKDFFWNVRCRRKWRFFFVIHKIFWNRKKMEGRRRRGNSLWKIEDLQKSFLCCLHWSWQVENISFCCNNGLTPGSQNSSKRQTIFFLLVDPMTKIRRIPRWLTWMHHVIKIDFFVRRGHSSQTPSCAENYRTSTRPSHPPSDTTSRTCWMVPPETLQTTESKLSTASHPAAPSECSRGHLSKKEKKQPSCGTSSAESRRVFGVLGFLGLGV